METLGAQPIATVQRLSVAAGREEAFWARFEELDVLALAADAADGELRRAFVVQEGATFLVITIWGSPAGIDRWVASPSRDVVFEALDPYYDAPPTVERYALRRSFDGAPA